MRFLIYSFLGLLVQATGNPSQYEPANIRFKKIDNKYLIQLHTENNILCAVMSVNSNYDKFGVRFRTCSGKRKDYRKPRFQNRFTLNGDKRYLWNIEKKTKNGLNYIEPSVTLNGVKHYWDVEKEGKFDGHINSKKERFNFMYTGDVDVEGDGILSTFTTGTTDNRNRRCISYNTAENYRELGFPYRRRANFEICNINKCNENRIEGEKCGSCNWVEGKSTECDSCEDKKIIPSNGSCKVLTADATCTEKWPGVIQLGFKNAELDEASCETCDESDNTVCDVCAVKNVVYGESITYDDIEPVNNVCECPENRVLSYASLSKKNKVNEIPVCALPCTTINDSLEKEENRCKSCDATYGDRCAECEHDNTLLDNNYKCYCDREDYTWNTEENKCKYKHEEHIEKLKEEPLVNLCFMYPAGAARDACEKNSKW